MQNIIDFSALPTTFSSESGAPVRVFVHDNPDGNTPYRAPVITGWLGHTIRPVRPSHLGEMPSKTQYIRPKSDVTQPAQLQEKDDLPSLTLRFASTKG
ncbi:hypothetical protein QFI91_16860 [Raoultella sp. WB_B2P2-3]|uniref:Uncharacterized protein n=1 Tax=Raoultella scottii TaxID=3040937 RepID=A0ABU8ZBF4_9ENTR